MNEYKKFSYYFDEAVANMDYNKWVSFVKPYLTKDSTILDLACGTGTFALLLKIEGYKVFGLDLSKEALEIAQEKAKINHQMITFHEADMTNFNLEKKFDVITCFFDSINFLDSQDDIANLFSCVKKHLNPNGLFIFDCFSKYFFDEYKHNKIKQNFKDFKIIWKTNHVDDRTLKHQITIKENKNKLVEAYFEYYHEIKSLNTSEFKLINISYDFNEEKKEDSERILVVLQLH